MICPYEAYLTEFVPQECEVTLESCWLILPFGNTVPLLVLPVLSGLTFCPDSFFFLSLFFFFGNFCLLNGPCYFLGHLKAPNSGFMWGWKCACWVQLQKIFQWGWLLCSSCDWQTGDRNVFVVALFPTFVRSVEHEWALTSLVKPKKAFNHVMVMSVHSPQESRS